MLTPAEELGLGGFNLASRIRRAFDAVAPSQRLKLLGRVRDESLRRHLVYLRDGRQELVYVFPCPLAVVPEQLAYIHSVSLTIHQALKRLPELYFSDPDVNAALRLTPEEDEWLNECWDGAHRDNNPVFGRLDAVVDFTNPMWKSSLKFMEPNMSGIGGLHMVPAAERIIFEHVVPALKRRDPHLELSLAADARELLMQEIRDHLEQIGRPAQTICFVEPKYAASGVDEQEELARHYHDTYGIRVLHADPSELELRDGEVSYAGQPIDVVYRDYPVNDLLPLRKQGVDIRPMRELFRQNRIISSIAAELDQKSCWEVLTNPAITERHFTADERLVFRRHILWTRIVSDRATTLPDGGTRPLLEFARRERETLVLKPNRAYGGEGVLIGPATEQAVWEAALDQALADPARWVIQQLAPIPVAEFPVIGPDGKVQNEPFHVVMGFAPTPYGVSILGRASQKQVVNVAQRGGMCVVFVGRPVVAFHGPSRQLS